MIDQWFVELNAMIDYNQLHQVSKLFTGKVGCTLVSMRFVQLRIISQPSNVKRNNLQWFNKRTWLARNQRLANYRTMRLSELQTKYAGWF